MTASDFDRDATGAHPARCGCAACRGMHQPDDANPSPAAVGGGRSDGGGAPDYAVDALLSGEVWHNDGDGVTLTYTYFDGVPTYYAEDATEQPTSRL